MRLLDTLGVRICSDSYSWLIPSDKHDLHSSDPEITKLDDRGDCGSCTITVGGSRIKACVGKVPPPPRLKSLQEKGLLVK